ncbi:MAG: glutamine-hydrolyzing carbamoyl-phosphate synthase small subunit [Candidatus Thermoplasmatota archaeon]|nr:glutamine-hydrolyzing carbamoyl-phosphate synthase small subunit [Candidatus Thermoplasmatota archaeon]
MRRYLLLEDGSSFEGKAFGSCDSSTGELVFNTSFTGYYEIMTDPSYGGQIIVFNFPSMFYYDYMKDIAQSDRISASGIVVKDGIIPGNSSFKNLDDLLKLKHVPGIYGIDTRKLTQKIRDSGNLKGFITSTDRMPDHFPEMDTEELIRKFSTKESYIINGEGQKKILFVDMGTKSSLLREVSKLGNLEIVNIFNLPETYEDYDGIFLSNGPGDPGNAVFRQLKKELKNVIGTVPVFGVCLGHQIIGEVIGGKIEKMKFGHHGSNHSVGNGQRSFITSHNHNFRIAEDSLNISGVEIMYRDMNDGTPEMIGMEEKMLLSAQFHPEGSPGPRDSTGFFDIMRSVMDGIRN